MERVDNKTCYWCITSEDRTEDPPIIDYLCMFDAEEITECPQDRVCIHYIDTCKINDYIRVLIEENKMLDEALTKYEEGLM